MSNASQNPNIHSNSDGRGDPLAVPLTGPLPGPLTGPLTVSGVVHLVGAGPGDVDLLTVRAVRALGCADVVLHDALLGPGILDLAPADAERIDVGKRAGQSSTQEMICVLMIELARQGKTVVRIKGGDPFVFGRGGEEAEALREAGVPYAIVPGISSAISAPGAAGIPVTHRNVSAAFTVVTGHRTDGALPVDWQSLAKVGGTIVVLMGIAQRGVIATELMAGGLAPNTPVAAVANATRENQSELRTTLAELANAEVATPAVLVIGAVAALDLRDRMNEFGLLSPVR
jgi:uroporphyrin-III C-methyltransferase